MSGRLDTVCISKILDGAKTAEWRRRWREVKKKKGAEKKVRWKRMYVEHVAAGIASMCHRGNHAGNAEAHLTALPSCIYLPPSYSVYIYCLRASTNRASSIALSLSLAITPRISPFLSARLSAKKKRKNLWDTKRVVNHKSHCDSFRNATFDIV